MLDRPDADAPERRRGRPIRDAGVALLLFALLALVLHGPVLAGDRVFSFRDLATYAIPHKLFSLAEMRAGRMPLWNPYNLFGFPHLANLQSGVLYPPNLLLFLPFPLGFNLVHVGHYLLAALGAFHLARQLQVGRAGALVAGVGYGFSPYFASLTDLNAFLFTASWLPWMVSCGLAAGRRPSPRTVAATTIVFAHAFLAGEPQTFLLGCLGALVSSLLVGPRRRAAIVRLAAAWATAAVIVALLVAPVLLPFLELVAASERSGQGLDRAQVYRYSVERGDLADLVLPGFSGDIVRGTVWRGEQTYVRRTYLGVVLVLLAAVGLGAVRRDRRVILLALVALSGLLLALGARGGLYPLLYAAGYTQSRFPVKFLVVTVLALALLAAIGVERWAVARSRALAVTALAAAIVGLAVGLLAPAEVARQAGLSTALVAVLSLATSRLPLEGASRLAWAVLLAADLLVASRPVLTTAPARLLVQPTGVTAGVTRRADHGCGFPRAYNPIASSELLRFVYPEDRVDERSLTRFKSLLFGNMNLAFGAAVVRGGESVEVRWVSELLELLDRGPRSRRLLDLAGAATVVHFHDLPGIGLAPELVEDGVWLMSNPSAMPHAFLVGEARLQAGAEERLADLGSMNFDPRRTGLVEQPVGSLSGVCAAPVTVTRCQTDALDLEVRSDGRCLLVVTDAWYPGWQVTVDGAEAELLRVDHAFRGVLVEPGPRVVRLRYAPDSFRRGVALCLAGVAGLVVVLLLARRACGGAGGSVRVALLE